MLTLIIGGARSGKSDLAQRLATASTRGVLFVATMQPGDDETSARIDAHRATRPAAWRTVEAPIEVVAALKKEAQPRQVVVLDCVTLWVSNQLIAALGDASAATTSEAAIAIDGIAGAARDLVAWCTGYDGDVIIVTNEAGQGVVPAYPLGRIFRDALGAANRIIAADAACVYYTVAGLALDLKALGATPIELFGAGETA